MIYPEHALTDQSWIPWWIILIAILAGVLLLALLVGLLWKVVRLAFIKLRHVSVGTGNGMF